MNNKVISYAALPHVLVVDDDDRIRTLVCRYLNEHGFLAVGVPNAADAKVVIKDAEFDVLVVDIMMPEQDGRELTAEIRKTSDIPILLLTALGEVEEKIKGLTVGADDYLPKPFDPRELLLRLQVILRRRPVHVPATEILQIGDWVFDPKGADLVSPHETIRLTDVELNLLRALAARPNDILSREALASVCGVPAGERTIDVQVTRLRKKMGEDSKAPKYLQTVRGKGYMLRAEKVGAC